VRHCHLDVLDAMQTVNLDQATLYTLPLLASLAFAITQADKFEFLSEVRDIFKVGGGGKWGCGACVFAGLPGGHICTKVFLYEYARGVEILRYTIFSHSLTKDRGMTSPSHPARAVWI